VSGKLAGVDLRDRPDEHQRPIGPASGDRVEELEVHALVDHAEPSETRAGDAGLVRRITSFALARRSEVGDVHGARERVDVRVEGPLRLEQRLSAGEHNVCGGHQLTLEERDARRRAAER
jgi:hypothetical protein